MEKKLLNDNELENVIGGYEFKIADDFKSVTITLGANEKAMDAVKQVVDSGMFTYSEETYNAVIETATKMDAEGKKVAQIFATVTSDGRAEITEIKIID